MKQHNCREEDLIPEFEINPNAWKETGNYVCMECGALFEPLKTCSGKTSAKIQAYILNKLTKNKSNG